MSKHALIGALALVAVNVAPCEVAAQASALPSVARVGVPSINTGLLRPGVDRFAVYMVEDKRRDLLARVTDEVSFVEVAPGDTAIRRIYQWATGEDSYSRVDTIFLDRNDLTLRRYSSRTGSAVSGAEWIDGHVRGTLQIGGKATPIDAWINAPVYHAGVLDLVARSSGLTNGFSASVYTFSPESGTIASAAISVTGADSIGIPQWRVQSEIRGMLTTYWVDRRSHRIIREARYMGKGFRIEVVPVATVAAAGK